MYIKSVHFQILSHLGKHYVMATTSSYFIVDLSVRLFFIFVFKWAAGASSLSVSYRRKLVYIYVEGYLLLHYETPRGVTSCPYFCVGNENALLTQL